MESVTEVRTKRKLTRSVEHTFVEGIEGKICQTCHEWHPLHDKRQGYCRNAGYEDGLEHKCRPCKEQGKTVRDSRTTYVAPEDTVALALIPDNAALFYDPETQRCNLTAMWRASEEGASREPSPWMALPSTQAFLVALATELKVEKSDLSAALAGRAGGTWAHWQLGVEYARYLSPAFSIRWNNYARAYLEQRQHATSVSAHGGAIEQAATGLTTFFHNIVRSAVDQAIDERLGGVPQQTAETWETVRGATVIEREVVHTVTDEWVTDGHCYLAWEPKKNLMSVGRVAGSRTPNQRMRDSDYNGAKGGDGQWCIVWATQTDDHVKLESKLHKLVEKTGAEKIATDTRGTYLANGRIAADFKRLPAKIKLAYIDQIVSMAGLFPLPLFYEVSEATV